MYNYNGRIIVFDDCDNALTDAVAVELLKGALDSSTFGPLAGSAPPRSSGRFRPSSISREAWFLCPTARWRKSMGPFTRGAS